MTAPEVADLSERIDIAALFGYRDAVGAQTREVIDAITDEVISSPVDADRYQRAHVLGEHAGWVGKFWAPWNGRDYLFLATGHCAGHWGEATTLRSIAGFAVGL